MNRRALKYTLSATLVLMWGLATFGTPVVDSGTYPERLPQEPPAQQQPKPLETTPERQQDPPPLAPFIVVPPPGIDTTGINLNAPGAIVDPGHLGEPTTLTPQEPTAPAIPDVPSNETPDVDLPTGFTPESAVDLFGIKEPIVLPEDRIAVDSIISDSLLSDSLRIDSLEADSLKRKQKPEGLRGTGNFLDEEISGHNRDSLIYDARNKMVYIFMEGDITYQDMNLKADYMEVNLDSKNIYGYGVTDSLGVKSRPEFLEGNSVYTMDTLTYNIDTKKAKIKGAATQEGDGYLIGRDIKKMSDNVVNIADGKYTTCDHIDHPHFYLAMTRAKLIPGKKVIVGPSYMVLEDVPLYFPFLPFGFFPVSSGRSSGFIMPSYGEESVKGFFIRDGGYYFAFNDYIDVTALGGIYTLGSWETSLSSRYIKRYKFSGGFNARFTKNIIGEKGLEDYVNTNQFSVQWTHTQDPKFKPNTTFSASVNFSTSGYNKYGSTTMNDYLNTQTNSSIAYSKTWPGKPFSFSTNFQHSQNSRDSTYTFTFPSAVFSVQRIYPFKRSERVGRERWYEKVSFTYTGTLTNSATVKEDDLFTETMLKNMRNGVNHNIPVSSSFTLFNYLNISPSFTYQERWAFRKIEQDWDPVENAVVKTDTTYGFYRAYNYSVSASANTKIYGEFLFKGQNPVVKAIRHVITPSVSMSWSPDFGDAKYGFWKPYQQDSMGTIAYYSPFSETAYGVPGRGRSASMSFSLQNTLEMKVRSDRDTTGVKKISVIDNLSFSGSYNFLADSMNLSVISAQLRTTIIKNFGLNINATFDPYQVDPNTGSRINKFLIRDGKLARLASASTSFGYTFTSSKSGKSNVVNDINSGGMYTPEQNDFFNNANIVDPNMRRMMMTSQYYDFDIPWNLGFNYSLSYSNNGRTKNTTQTLGFNASVTPTPKWGISMNGGYDFQKKKITPGVVTITRDLHCWQMNLSWVPVGFQKSWSFNISVRSAVLRDLKYDKRNSNYDNIY